MTADLFETKRKWRPRPNLVTLADLDCGNSRLILSRLDNERAVLTKHPNGRPKVIEARLVLPVSLLSILAMALKTAMPQDQGGPPPWDAV